VQFVKMHGAGNDFILLDLLRPEARAPWADGQDATAWADLARRVCDRHFGIGSDGLLLVLPSSTAHARMRMFNPDGSESASCGNGIRCLGRYVRDRYGLGTPDLRVETAAGVTTITVRGDGAVTVDMGEPIFDPARIPTAIAGSDALHVVLELDGALTPYGRGMPRPYSQGERGRILSVSCISMGNPHAVTFVEPGMLDDYPLESVGPRVERHPLFPERTNFEVCEVLGADHMRVRVWERGAGITLACGTGACAATVVAVTAGKARAPLRVELPGGELCIEWAPGGPVLMTGPAEYVFTGSIPAPRDDALTPALSQRERGSRASA
jgi:diaminopimelate epimerase